MIVKLWDKIGRIRRTSFAEHSFWMVGGQGSQAAVAFLANLILVRYLFPEEFGLYALVQASIGLAATTFSLRINTILLQVSEEELRSGKKDLYLSVLVGQTFLVCLGSLALLWLFGLLNLWAMVLLLNVLTDPWINAQRVLYERKFNYKNLSLVESGSHVVSHVFSVIGVVLGLGPAVLYLRGWIQTLGHLGGLSYVGGLQGYRVRWLMWEEWKFVFRQIRGYWLEGWLSQSFERLVIMFLGLLEGQQMTGYFYQARRLAGTPHQLFDPVSSRILFNFLSQRIPSAQGIQILQRILKVQIPLLLLISTIAVIGADPIIPWLFGPRWEPVVPIFQAMVGLIIGLTPIASIKAYYASRNHMWPYIAFGLGVQYCAFAIALLAVVLLNFSAVYGIVVGMSVGYLGGLLVLTTTLGLFQRKFEDKANRVQD